MDTELAKLIFNQTVEKYHQALGEFNNGNAQPFLELFSEQEDISLANQIGPAVRGRTKVVESAKQAASNLRQGEATGFDNLVKVVTPDLAYIVEIERYQTRLGGRSNLAPLALRATSIFHLEGSGWKLLHRHADPMVSIQPAETMIKN